MIEYHNNAFKHHRLDWKESKIVQVVDACFSGDSLFLLITHEGLHEKLKLSIHRFSLSTWAHVAKVDLPDPCLIWSSPVCSNLIEYRGKAYVGVVTKRLIGYGLVMTAWDGKSSVADHRTLTSRIDWNTSLSLANIKADALIAYHYPGDSKWRDIFTPAPAAIRTIPFTLE